MVHFLLSVAVVLSCLSTTTAFAEDFLPEEIPPQRALSLLKAKGARNIYYLLTKDEESANHVGGNHYLLVYENGKLRFPRQKSGAVYFDGGSTDLLFENGERLVVPTDRFSVGYLGVQKNPMMMSADRAPYTLQKVAITDEVLKRLGFSKFIAPKTEVKQSVSREREEYIPFILPETVQVIEFKPATKLGYQEKDQIYKLVNEIDPTRIKTDDRANQGAFYGYGDSILIAITDATISLPQLRAKLAGRGEVSVVSDSVYDSYAKNFATLKSDSSKASDAEKLASVESIFESMGELERYFIMIDRMAQYETAAISLKNGVKEGHVGTAYNAKARRSHPFYTTALAKIRSAARAGYEALDQIGHPAGQEILTHTAQEFDYVALDIAKGKATVGGQYYFDLWLKFMLSDLDFSDKLSENGIQKPEDLHLKNSMGGVYRDLHVSGRLVGFEGRGIISHIVMSGRPKFLLNFLGFPGQKERLKTSLIQFIIDADRKAAKIVAWADRVEAARVNRYATQSSFDAKGVSNINDLIISLAWTTYWATGIEGFSIGEYQRTVMEIFTTLFDIAPTSLKTTGTMAALIDASIHILNDVQNTKSILKRNPSPRVEQAARTLENRLRLHLQSSLVSLGRVNSAAAVSSCEILLSPNSYEMARKANGW